MQYYHNDDFQHKNRDSCIQYYHNGIAVCNTIIMMILNTKTGKQYYHNGIGYTQYYHNDDFKHKKGIATQYYHNDDFQLLKWFCLYTREQSILSENEPFHQKINSFRLQVYLRYL